MYKYIESGAQSNEDLIAYSVLLSVIFFGVVFFSAKYWFNLGGQGNVAS